jgi:NAD(P)H-flavin reductase
MCSCLLLLLLLALFLQNIFPIISIYIISLSHTPHQLGEYVEISGPWGPIEYTAPGTFVYMKKEMKKTNIGMMAGGSGITPMLQVSFATSSSSYT